MQGFTPEELSEWISRPWENGVPDGTVTGISKDTRTIRPGDLYIAIRGPNFDGHGFVTQAFEKGAAGALVDEHFAGEEGPLLRSADTVDGLQAMAKGYRETWASTVIGITGSVGKTTIKDMCADVLSMKGETHRTDGNYNNHIGLPLTMMDMPRKAEYGVFELGMNHPGEIRLLAGLLRPDIGIIADIANAHRENFGSLEEIAAEKAQLAAQVPASGKVILDRDSEWFELFCSHTCAGVITVSMKGNADYIGSASDALALTVTPHSPNLEAGTFTMPLPGEHIMRNAMRAVALGLELGVAPADIAESLLRFRPASMRWETSEVNGITFINDAYNANPLSMQANLRTFASLPGEGRKWVVVGGMRELGDISDAEHAALGRYIDGLDMYGVITVGGLGEGIACSGTERVFHAPENVSAAAVLKAHLQSGDQVLLKASRSERLEQVLEFFKEI